MIIFSSSLRDLETAAIYCDILEFTQARDPTSATFAKRYVHKTNLASITITE